MKNKFLLTFSVVTEKSAQHGDFARHGYVTKNMTIPERTYLPKHPTKFGLKEAIDFLQKYKGDGPVEADSYPISRANPPRWFSVNSGLDEHGESLEINLHLPKNISGSSAMRITRLLDCYGIKK